jgi:AAHS family 4-hydroxybenzoate transporter-like MFS transporter
VFAFIVPESARFLAMKGDAAGVAKVLARVNSTVEWNGALSSASGSRASVRHLFEDGRALGTSLLWIALFLSLFLGVALVSWLPLLARASGIDAKSAVLAVSAFNIGGILGCYLIGRFSRRLGLIGTIGLSYAVGAVGVALLGYAGHSGRALLFIAFVAGMFVIGAQMCVIGLAASFYDTSRRATGAGWALAAGKLGSVIGPMIGGVLITAGLGMPALFGVAALVSLAACLVVLGLRPAYKLLAAEPATPVAAPGNIEGAVLAPAYSTLGPQERI